MGIVLYITQKEIFLLYALGGMAILELSSFYLYNCPAIYRWTAWALRYNWFRCAAASKKNICETMLMSFDKGYAYKERSNAKLPGRPKKREESASLSFPNYHSIKQNIPEINAVLQRISGKSVVEN